jgi:hypothetical protein
MKTWILIGILISIALEMAWPMGWRGSPEPNVTAAVDQPYEVGKEKVFEGKILRIDPPPCVAEPLYSYHILLQMEGGPIEVHLGPCWYTVEQKPELKVNDHIRVAGMEASWRSGPRRVFIAREIRRGKDVLRFRDAAGKSLWRKGLRSSMTDVIVDKFVLG